jgi:hypothetical protein
MSIMLQAELDWIDANTDMYDSPLHAHSVKMNIQKQYVIKDMGKRIKHLEQMEAFIHNKVQTTLDSLQLKINTAKHIMPSPLDSDEWAERVVLLKRLHKEYIETGSVQTAFTFIGVAETSRLILY